MPSTSADKLALHWVHPELVLTSDWAWLRQADYAGPAFGRIPELQIHHLLKQGHMHLFRIQPGPGVLLTEVVVGASGIKRLNIVRAAGENVGWSIPALAKLLVATAREWGCEAVETDVFSQRLAEALIKVGAKTESVKLVLKVGGEDGQ